MASTYLHRTMGSGDRNKWTLSVWVKKCKNGDNQRILTVSDNATYDDNLRFDADDKLLFVYNNATVFMTNRRFRDVNAWYHIVLKVDTSQATADDRVLLYINGVHERTNGGYSTDNIPAQNQDGYINHNVQHVIGMTNPTAASNFFDGCMSHYHFTDGYAYDASTFGSTDSTTGEWEINTAPSITMGTNGFTILKDANTITDQSSNSNDFTLGAGTLTKSEDCPSNVFCTMNPLTQEHTGSTIGYSSGNTNIFFDQTGQWWHTTSTLGAITGKYYAECKIDAVGGEASLGIISSDTACANQGSGDYMGKETDSISYFNNGRTMKANSEQQTGLTSLSSGTIVGIAMDLDNNTVQFYINGSAEGNTVSLTADKFYLFGCSGYSDTRFYWNFGNGYFNTTAISSEGTNASGIGKFEYNVPANYTALSTKGLNE